MTTRDHNTIGLGTCKLWKPTGWEQKPIINIGILVYVHLYRHYETDQVKQCRYDGPDKQQNEKQRERFRRMCQEHKSQPAKCFSPFSMSNAIWHLSTCYSNHTKGPLLNCLVKTELKSEICRKLNPHQYNQIVVLSESGLIRIIPSSRSATKLHY